MINMFTCVVSENKRFYAAIRYIHTNLYSAKNRENESETLAQGIGASTGGSPVWARGRCRISPPRFLAECSKRQLNQASYVFAVF